MFCENACFRPKDGSNSLFIPETIDYTLYRLNKYHETKNSKYIKHNKGISFLYQTFPWFIEGGKVQNLVWDGGREVHLNNELVVRTQNIWKSNIFSRIKTPRIPLIFIEKILANHQNQGGVTVQNYNWLYYFNQMLREEIMERKVKAAKKNRLSDKARMNITYKFFCLRWLSRNNLKIF